MRVAVVFKDRCQPKKCHLECMAVCPPQRTGTEVIWLDPESGKAAISEETCISCGLCLPAGVPISTARGVVPIEKVEVGDLVLTHRGRYRRVSTLHRHDFTGRLYRIRSAGQADPLEVTNDHPVLAVIRRPIKYGRRLRKALGVLKWVTPDELKEGDYLVKPRIRETWARQRWEVPIQVAVSGGRYPQWAEQLVSIPICEDIARLVGYYLAEGFADDRRVTFSFHEREQAYRDDVRSIVHEYFDFNGYEVQGNGHARLVRYNSALLARVLGTLGAHCHEKSVPYGFMVSRAPVRSQLMRGLWWGDGYWDRRRNTFTLSTTSPNLAYQSQEVLASLGIISNMYSRSIAGKKRDYHVTVMGGESTNSMAALFGVEFTDKRNRFSTWSMADEEYIYIPIRKVECEPVENLPVFNLEVEEDETYVAAGHVVHNCIKKCPFDAIRIIGLPDELEEDKVHQFGRNGFRLFRLPAPKAGQVVGLLGPNGVGKTTALNILSGQLVPNLGDWEHDPTWDAALDQYAGTELHNYLKRIADGDLRAALKPQYVDRLPRAFSGQVGELLRRVDERNRLDEVAEELSLTPFLDHDLRNISGGELQRTALAATILKDADVYFFDEPSSYLDIFQRLRVARAIQRLSREKQVVVVEHDLAILDWLADQVYLLYGEEGTYGVVAQPRPVRTAINVYLGGYLKEENIRFRDREVRFEVHPPKEEWKAEPLVAFDALEKHLDGFHLATAPGAIRRGEVVGVVGPNATGKTTFVRMLAGELRPDGGQVKGEWRVSYKPQYISLDSPGTVRELLAARLGKLAESGYFESEVGHPLGLKGIMEKEVANLSGGEQQRVAIAVALGQEADIYLLDEPSAYLDSNQRVEAAKTIRRVMENAGKSALIVDHDVYFIDMVSDSLMVFGGEPGRQGQGEGPFPMREGMNRFLRDVGVTFRRDPDSRRPRINKPGSSLDRGQKGSGEYYYALA